MGAPLRPDASSREGGAARPALSERIRVATWNVHEEAQRAPYLQDLLGGRLDATEYALLVAQHYVIYGAIEAAAAVNDDPVVAPFLSPALDRAPALASDLEYLLGPGWRSEYVVAEATERYRAHIDAVCRDSGPALLAHHYVCYLGALSGGQIIGRLIVRVFGFEDHHGTEYYRFPDVPSPSAHKDHYRELIDSLPWDDATQQALLDEILVAYRHNTDVLLELGRLVPQTLPPSSSSTLDDDT